MSENAVFGIGYGVALSLLLKECDGFGPSVDICGFCLAHCCQDPRLAFLLNFLEAKAKKTKLALSKNQFLILLGIGVSAALFNLFMQEGYKYAPNPGYVAAINTSSIMSLTVLSALIFKDSLSLKKVAGILGVIVGLLIIIL